MKIRRLTVPAVPHLMPQPIVSILTLMVASIDLVLLAPRLSLPNDAQAIVSGVLPVTLAFCVILGFLFPIHVGRSTKIYLQSLPLFLIVVLLHPVVAAFTAGFAMLIGEVLVCRKRKNYASDVVTSAARWTLVTILAACVAHAPLFSDAWLLPGLVCTALIMWCGDMITAPLVIAPMVQERPFSVLRTVVRQSAAPEAVQYVLAVLAASAATAQPWSLLLLIPPVIVVYRYFKRTRELHETTRALLENLADSVDLRDAYTGGHSRRVAWLTSAILGGMSITGLEAEVIEMSARLHDIGKIEVPDHVLLKPGNLSEAEWAVLKAHPDTGADLLATHTTFRRGVEIVRHHHEAWDGSGYPRGLRETTIPFGARVIAVADSYDAMTSDRPYRSGMSPAQAVKRLLQGKGSQWDPAIVDAFVRVLPQILQEMEQPSYPVAKHAAAPAILQLAQ